jgi:hypothetical protein
VFERGRERERERERGRERERERIGKIRVKIDRYMLTYRQLNRYINTFIDASRQIDR